ncbi:cytochrome c oxidase assembly protein [Herbiconiux sp. L3-i23]|uniref:cytochrome c oxidase assembly protein n=1 Tax=Herbiconiux sp. L3-i23 TaxID=2905871 RepID=UPI002051A0E9|nr:cytochrome c oxidase assembly protein [Herbiconiux sp. L3-i23]BDI21261.1 hypothetical protein L3i23_00370 [Herbiconiux sp. L3-i23]
MDADSLPIPPEGAPDLLAFLSPGDAVVPVLPVAMTVIAALYLAGLIRVKLSGRAWPAWRAVSFLVGCLAVVATTGLALEDYGYRMFSVFMFQQLTLMMAVPPLLVLGAPMRLLLDLRLRSSAGRRITAGVIAVMRSRGFGFALQPAFTIPLFLLSFYGLYLTDLADLLLGSIVGHVGLEVFFLVAGMLFTVPLLSTGPMPFRMTHHGRLLDLFVEMPLHAFFGVFLMMGTRPLVNLFATPPVAWDIDPIADQAVAGGLAWSYGEAPTLIMILIMLGRWYRSDTRKAQERDRRVDRDGDAELEAYNERLRLAAERDHRRL